MTFDQILPSLKEGKRAVRRGWNSQDTGWLILVTFEAYETLMLRKSSSQFMPWTNAAHDIVANDWELWESV